MLRKSWKASWINLLTLITDDLPRWLADHSFDQNSNYYTDYRVTREQAFQYLTLFATERVLNDALVHCQGK